MSVNAFCIWLNENKFKRDINIQSDHILYRHISITNIPVKYGYYRNSKIV